VSKQSVVAHRDAHGAGSHEEQEQNEFGYRDTVIEQINGRRDKTPQRRDQEKKNIAPFVPAHRINMLTHLKIPRSSD
jgi:hypothetical protein